MLFLSVRLFNELRNNSTLIVCVTILCFSAKYFFVKHLKQKKYVQAIHKEYLQMDLKKRKENYKIGLYYVVFVILFPLFSILVMELIEFITDNWLKCYKIVMYNTLQEALFFRKLIDTNRVTPERIITLTTVFTY